MTFFLRMSEKSINFARFFAGLRAYAYARACFSHEKKVY
jgi:hypothetical protein